MTELLALIIEDDYDLSNIFTEALRAAGFQSQTFRSGDTALAGLSSATPDVVVLDLHLPRVAGTEILGKIRTDPRLKETRVIIVTGDAALADNPIFQQDDVVQILVKPVTYKQLRDLAQLVKLLKKAS